MIEEQAARPLETGPEFHWKDGWFFARVTEAGDMQGAVRIRWVREECIPAGDTMPGGKHTICSEFFIPAAEWASIVAAVTPEGDNATTYRLAVGLHG